MQPISADIVEATWKRIAGMSPMDAAKLSRQMHKHHPFILAYLLAVGGNTLNKAERELLVYMGIVVWQIMLKGNTELPRVSEKDLEKAEESNMRMLDYMIGELGSDFIDTTKKLMENYAQPEVFWYVIEALVEDEEGLVRKGNEGMMAIYLKTVIDCLNK